MRKKFLLLFLLVLTVVPFLSAAPAPFLTEDSEVGLDLAYRPIEVLPLGEAYRVHIHVFNKSSSDLMTNETTDCFYHLYNRSGWDIDAQVLEWEAYNNVDFAKTIEGGNFSQPGFYSIIIQCNSTGTGTGYVTGYFEVTTTGQPESLSNSPFSLFIVLMILSVAIFILGYFLDSDWLVFLSGILWILTGMYGMIYGIGSIANLYTRAISAIFIVTGIVFIIGSAYNVTNRDD